MAGKLIVEFSCSTGCNLRCKYCYSAHDTSVMTRDIADNFFEAVKKMMIRYSKDTYHISYFGGEPLLNWDIIEYTLPKFSEDPLCSSIVLISNGLLLDQYRVDFLKKYKCGLSLSFDGLWQDSNRPQESKTSSFQQYLEKRPLFSQLTDTCKVMISSKNFKTMTENYKFFVEEYNFLRPDFCLVRDPIFKQSDIQIYKNEIKRLGNQVIDYNKRGIQSSVGLFDLYLLDILANMWFGKRDHGCFVGVGGAVYTTSGDFYPCERFRSVNKLKLYDGKSKLLNHDNLNFLSRPEVTDPRCFDDCKNCEIYEYCNVGCTFSQLREGKWKKSKPVNSICELFKITYNEALRVYNECNKYNKLYENYLINRLEKGG